MAAPLCQARREEVSGIIKNTGMTEVEFPIRVKFSLNEDSSKEVIKAVEYIKTVIK